MFYRARIRDDLKMAGRGRLSGAKAGAGPSGFCVCPECGYRVRHTRGSPCMNRTCRKCGSSLTRE